MSKTEENLQAAFAGESQARNKYTYFAAIARKEGYNYIAKIEKHHAERYKKLLAMVENGTVYKREKPIVWKCSVCGYTHEGTEPPAKCPCCQHPREYYEPADLSISD